MQMLVQIKEVETKQLIQEFHDVKDVSEGILGLALIEMPDQNILFPVQAGQYIEIHKNT